MIAFEKWFIAFMFLIALLIGFRGCQVQIHFEQHPAEQEQQK